MEFNLFQISNFQINFGQNDYTVFDHVITFLSRLSGYQATANLIQNLQI